MGLSDWKDGVAISEMEKVGGGGRAVVVFGKGRIRRLILDSLHLRRLLGRSTVDVKRPLEMYESGVQESGLRR